MVGVNGCVAFSAKAVGKGLLGVGTVLLWINLGPVLTSIAVYRSTVEASFSNSQLAHRPQMAEEQSSLLWVSVCCDWDRKN